MNVPPQIAAAIYGVGGHAHVIASILKVNNINILGFFDDSFQGEEFFFGRPLLGKFKKILDYKNSISSVYIAIGDNLTRRNAFVFLRSNGFDLPALIHPTTTIEQNVLIQDSAVICLGAILSTEVRVGKGAIINTGCSVDHESEIKDFSHLAPKTCVAGRTIIGENTFVGMNSSIADKLTIGDNVTIGAGSVILKDIARGEKIIGIHH